MANFVRSDPKNLQISDTHFEGSCHLIFADVCIAPISLYYHACTKAGFDNMIYNNKKHFYDPYDSLDAEWKARHSHEMLSVRKAAQLSGFSRQDINRTMPRCLRRK